MTMTFRKQRSRRVPVRSGMTLVEVVVAATILTGAVLGMAGYIANFARTANAVREQERAGQLAVERVEEVKGGMPYDSLPARYARVESGLPGFGSLVRTTTLSRIGGPTANRDYMIVTVDVTSPRLRKPVHKTTVISQF